MNATRDAFYTPFAHTASPNVLDLALADAMSRAGEDIRPRMLIARAHLDGLLGMVQPGFRARDEDFGAWLARAEGRQKPYAQASMSRIMLRGTDSIVMANAFADVCGVARSWLLTGAGGMLDGAHEPLPIVWARDEAKAPAPPLAPPVTPPVAPPSPPPAPLHPLNANGFPVKPKRRLEEKAAPHKKRRSS